MTIEIAIVVAGVMVFVGAIILGGIIHEAMDKLTDAIKNQR